MPPRRLRGSHRPRGECDAAPGHTGFGSRPGAERAGSRPCRGGGVVRHPSERASEARPHRRAVRPGHLRPALRLSLPPGVGARSGQEPRAIRDRTCLSQPGIHLPGRGGLFRAQAIREPLPRAEQGDEPQQLYRDDWRDIRAAHGSRQRAPGEDAVGGRRSGGAEGGLPHHTGCGQHPLPGLRAAPRPGHGEARERAGRGHSDSLQRGAGGAGNARADCRGDDRHPVQHSSGIRRSRGDLLGGGERAPPHACSPSTSARANA